MAPGGEADAAGLAGSSTEGGGEARLTPSAVNRLLMELLVYLGRTVLVCYPVYVSGYLGLSISWVLLGMVLVCWWSRNRLWKDARIGTAIDFVDNELHVINRQLESHLPMASWVNFPEVEKVDWVNKVLDQAWPFFGMFMEKLLKGTIQTAVRNSSSALNTFTFTKVHFGHIPPRITGIKAYTHEVDHREVILDMDISYEGDVDIDADVQASIKAGIKGMALHGMLRVILEPLIGQVPLVGGVTFFFFRRPTLEINWTGMTNLLDSPVFSSVSDEAIMKTIASMMVLPNRMCFPLIDQVKVDQMRFPLPRGVVRVHLLEARNLVAKDTYMLGLVKGKSDPYAKVQVGDQEFQSKTIKENLDPVWNEVYEFVVHEAPGQELEVECYDQDTDKDDFIGRFQLDLGEVKKEKELDQWFPLTGVESGEIHLKLVWLSPQSDASLLEESDDGYACAMLAVYLDCASRLPNNHSEITQHHKHGVTTEESRLTKKSKLNSFVELAVNKAVHKSKIVYGSNNPAWEEGFTFFVHDVKTQQLLVQVKQLDHKTPLGVLVLPLSRLLNISNMVLDQSFLLEHSGANSKIKLKATLRVLTVKQPLPKMATSPDPAATQEAPLSGPGVAPSTASSPKQPSVKFSSSNAPQNATNADFPAHRRGSFLPSDTRRPPDSVAHMRRYDSHSLLSENSITSSRFDLSKGASYPEALRKHQGSFGEISLTIRYDRLKDRLIVLVNSCRNLFPCSENGTDSYVRMYLLPDQSWIHRKRTHVKKRTVNPIHNDRLEFDVSLMEAQHRALDVSVKNNKMLISRERKDIGMVTIDLSQIDLIKGSTEWYELTLPGLKKCD